MILKIKTHRNGNPNSFVLYEGDSIEFAGNGSCSFTEEDPKDAGLDIRTHLFPGQGDELFRYNEFIVTQPGDRTYNSHDIIVRTNCKAYMENHLGQTVEYTRHGAIAQDKGTSKEGPIADTQAGTENTGTGKLESLSDLTGKQVAKLNSYFRENERLFGPSLANEAVADRTIRYFSKLLSAPEEHAAAYPDEEQGLRIRTVDVKQIVREEQAKKLYKYLEDHVDILGDIDPSMGMSDHIIKLLDDHIVNKKQRLKIYQYLAVHVDILGDIDPSMGMGDHIVKLLDDHIVNKKSDMIQIIFDGPPGAESGRFVEVNNSDGASIDAGDWVEQGKFWALQIKI